MSQDQIYDWLKVRRQTGSEEFFTAVEIAKYLSLPPNEVSRNLRILLDYGLVDLEIEGFNHRKYRYKVTKRSSI